MTGEFDPLSALDAHLSLYAQCAADRVGAVGDLILVELRGLSDNGPTDEELRLARDSYRRNLEIAEDGRIIWGRDGVTVAVGQAVWRDGDEAIRMIDAAVPGSLHFPEWDPTTQTTTPKRT